MQHACGFPARSTAALNNVLPSRCPLLAPPPTRPSEHSQASLNSIAPLPAPSQTPHTHLTNSSQTPPQTTGQPGRAGQAASDHQIRVQCGGQGSFRRLPQVACHACAYPCACHVQIPRAHPGQHGEGALPGPIPKGVGMRAAIMVCRGAAEVGKGWREGDRAGRRVGGWYPVCVQGGP